MGRDPRRRFTRKQIRAIQLVTDRYDEGLEADHIKPHSKGGQTVVENLQMVDPKANRKKGDKWREPRGWQALFLKEWRRRDRGSPFLLCASPASGKTFASLLAARDFLNEVGRGAGQVIVVCFSRNSAEQWRQAAVEFGIQLMTKEIGKMGFSKDFKGGAVTYAYVCENHDQLRGLMRKPTMVILDEAHHCADPDGYGESRYGQKIDIAFELSEEKLLLSGTPWRTDGQPMPFVSYDSDGVVIPQYKFLYSEAVRNGVVRAVQFENADGRVDFASGRVQELKEGVSDEEARGGLGRVLRGNFGFLRKQIKASDAKLTECRRIRGDAGALALCMDVDHAEKVAKVIEEVTGEAPVVVHQNKPSSNEKINQFRKSAARWLVSVRMVSEGTDIERLMVISYLTNYATELFFRQAAGRVMRYSSDAPDRDGWMLIPSDPRLLRYAKKMNDERVQALRLSPPTKGPGSDVDVDPPPFDPYKTDMTDEAGIVNGRPYSKSQIDVINQVSFIFGLSMGEAEEMLRERGAAGWGSDDGREKPGDPEEPLEVRMGKVRTEIAEKVKWLAAARAERGIEPSGHSDIHKEANKLVTGESWIGNDKMDMEQLEKKLSLVSSWLAEAKAA